ncbi:protein-L-isoaspartate(D-aspartate) O-methyltransferase [Sungkyunkwania multivorans]|uniref:Protein-L-isoaspartate O-methyltransferase n=1 Tax=Sungkyunkwania multivorans TaxID=1173618 RepID=A0ABW3CY88_9FLAO
MRYLPFKASFVAIISVISYIMKRLVVIISFISFIMGCAQDDYLAKRQQMVETQLTSRDINDAATLRAMRTVPRHLFVPEHARPLAYNDYALSIGHGQTISQPYIVAYMTQMLNLKPTDIVLEIGTGSGYQAAVLAKIVDSVYTIEIVKELTLSAKDLLSKLGYVNVNVKHGDGYHGWPSRAPFDAIMVTAGADSIPQPLIDQLKVGGRMIIPVSSDDGGSRLVLVKKRKNNLVTRELLRVRFVPFTREKEKN